MRAVSEANALEGSCLSSEATDIQTHRCVEMYWLAKSSILAGEVSAEKNKVKGSERRYDKYLGAGIREIDKTNKVIHTWAGFSLLRLDTSRDHPFNRTLKTRSY